MHFGCSDIKYEIQDLVLYNSKELHSHYSLSIQCVNGVPWSCATLRALNVGTKHLRTFSRELPLVSKLMSFLALGGPHFPFGPKSGNEETMLEAE